jgi:hypothetical protein
MPQSFTDAEKATPYPEGSQVLVDGEWWTVQKSEWRTYPPAWQDHHSNTLRDGWLLVLKGHGLLRTVWHWDVKDAKR